MTTLSDQAYRNLRDLLVSGQVQPGEKLSLRSLAERLGVSMQPVRQAVSMLVADEALEVTPNRAVRVPLMTRGRFDELTRIRLAIEGFAAHEAALRRSTVALAEIRRHERQFSRQCSAREPDAALAVVANRDLHFAVYRAAGLPSLLPIIEGLWLRIGPILNLDLRAGGERLRHSGAKTSHAELARAIGRRDADGARHALEHDIRETADFILRRGELPAGAPATDPPDARTDKRTGRRSHG